MQRITINEIKNRELLLIDDNILQINDLKCPSISYINWYWPEAVPFVTLFVAILDQLNVKSILKYPSWTIISLSTNYDFWLVSTYLNFPKKFEILYVIFVYGQV